MKKIFQCYGRGDKEIADQFREKLVLNLKGLPPELTCEYWYDGDLLCGDDWEDEIERRLNASEVGIVLISPAMLASNFIRRVELPRLLKGGKAVMPVLLTRVIKQADLQGLEAKQIFAREVKGCRESFQEQKTDDDRQAFVVEFIDQLTAQLQKSSPITS